METKAGILSAFFLPTLERENSTSHFVRLFFSIHFSAKHFDSLLFIKALMKISSLHIYPVKSAGGIRHTESRMEKRGLRHDRRWLITDERFQFLTQRAHPRMCLLHVNVTESALTMSAQNYGSLSVSMPVHSTHEVEVRIWNDRCLALVCSEEADRWISNFMGFKCHLVFLPDHVHRAVDRAYGNAGDIVSFADAYPVLILSEATLEDLNGRLDIPVSMTRFRPNIVISGCNAFAEDGWRRIRIGVVELEIVKPCSRCTIPTVDPDTGERGTEPIHTLSTYRMVNGKVLFGQNAIPRNEGVVRVGDAVEVITYAENASITAIP